MAAVSRDLIHLCVSTECTELWAATMGVFNKQSAIVQLGEQELLSQYLGTVDPFHPGSITHDIVLPAPAQRKINDKIIFRDLSTLQSWRFRQFRSLWHNSQTSQALFTFLNQTWKWVHKPFISTNLIFTSLWTTWVLKVGKWVQNTFPVHAKLLCSREIWNH